MKATSKVTFFTILIILGAYWMITKGDELTLIRLIAVGVSYLVINPMIQDEFKAAREEDKFNAELKKLDDLNK